MSKKHVFIRNIDCGADQLFLIAGPCVIEEESLMMRTAERLKKISASLELPLVFKSSFSKDNRSSLEYYQGPGLEAGLRMLEKIKREFDLPILTDIHEPGQAAAAAMVADIIQIPAFLSRQTDLLVAAARTGAVVNIKKGQFLAPNDVRHAIAKVTAAGNQRVLVTERGVSFGYNNLVVDVRAFPMLRELGYPVVFDVTHSLQLPGAGDGVTSGLAQYIEPLASAGVAAGVDAIFMEVHEDPARARSDAANALRLDHLEPLIRKLQRIDAASRERAIPDAAAVSSGVRA